MEFVFSAASLSPGVGGRKAAWLPSGSLFSKKQGRAARMQVRAEGGKIFKYSAGCGNLSVGTALACHEVLSVSEYST